MVQPIRIRRLCACSTKPSYCFDQHRRTRGTMHMCSEHKNATSELIRTPAVSSFQNVIFTANGLLSFQFETL